MPRGANQLVSRFLAYHKHLLPVRGFKTIRAEDISAVGVVDTQMMDRLGPASAWLQMAEHVVVVDHHMGAASDIEPDELIRAAVGSTTTVLVERLRALVEDRPQEGDGKKNKLELTQTEATLFSLGIRADTGQLTFPSTTPRDAKALAWLMEQGCSQSAIAEFGQARLSNKQRDLLSKAIGDIRIAKHEGMELGWVVLDTGRGFVMGMASVAEELLQMLGIDCVLVGVIHTNSRAQAYLSLIGRTSARAEGRGIDLNTAFKQWQGGGHPAAAAASIRLAAPPVQAGVKQKQQWREVQQAAEELSYETLDEEQDDASDEVGWVMQELLKKVMMQIYDEVTAKDVMSTSLVRAAPNSSMDEVLALMDRKRRKTLPVVGDDDTLLGFLKYRDAVQAVRGGKGAQQAKSRTRREVLTIAPDMPFSNMEELLLVATMGRLYVVDNDGKLLGLVSRTDLLRQLEHYKDQA